MHANPHKTRVLIDGYNLIHVTRFAPRGSREGVLQKARQKFLEFLADQLERVGYRDTTIVFDANDVPRDWESSFDFRQIHVLFARDHNSADELIAEMIQADAAPQQLLVVSSDHSVQLAARRRRAMYQDSDEWFDQLVEAPDQPNGSSSKDSGSDDSDQGAVRDEKADPELRDIDWMSEFGFE